ncbi:MAG: glycoside hydrolase family 99-like domain-containing protein [Nitrososphaerales archaeon]|nr:glycoside hydrolase family 99-like domain-containing protein [Nitrososphaerales archaeon]
MGEPYSIGAWYFTAWNDVNDYQALNSYNLYGRQDPWGGVRDYALGRDPLNIGGNYSSRRPLLGFYDLLDQSVMDSQIQEAASRGLSYFAFYWYWDADKNREANVSAPAQRFVTSPYKNLMKFFIAPIPVGDVSHLTLAMWENSVVPYMVTHYISDSAYLRTTDGRPIVVDFGWWLNDTAHVLALSYLRSATMAAVGQNPVILFVAQPVHTTSDLTYAQNHLGLDGFTCFTFAPAYPGESYDHTLSLIVPTLERQNMSFYVPCGTTGEDTRPWWRVGYGFGIQPNQMLYNTNITFSSFQQNLLHLKQYMDGNATRTSKMLTLYAWNEWGEGGYVEPDAINGYRFLDITKSVFGLVPNAKQPTFDPNGAVIADWHAPQRMVTGGVALVNVTVRNTGTTTWTRSAGYKLGSQNPQDNTVWGLNRVSLNSTEAVAPGQTKVFSFNITAPFSVTSRVYNFRWRMVQEGTGWFGDSTTTLRITVVPGTTTTTFTSTTITITSTSTTTTVTPPSTTTTTSTTISTTAPSSTTTSASTTSTTTTEVSRTATTATTVSSATSTTTATGGGGIPEFPYQLLAAAAFTVLLVFSYLVVRVRGPPRRP